MFPGSAALLAWADDLREVRTICHCGRKATMVVRLGPDGQPERDGAQVVIGGNDTYGHLDFSPFSAVQGQYACLTRAGRGLLRCLAA